MIDGNILPEAGPLKIALNAGCHRGRSTSGCGLGLNPSRSRAAGLGGSILIGLRPGQRGGRLAAELVYESQDKDQAAD
jgi:hypothetical protein